MAKLHVLSVSVFLVLVSYFSYGQTEPADPVSWFHPNQEVRVSNLPSLTASSTDSSAVLTTALEIIFHDKAMCCAKGSAFEAAALSGPQSLKDLSAALQGGHPWSDHPLTVQAKYFAQGSIEPGLIINALVDHHAAIIEWKSHIYVVYGAIFDETLYYSGRRQYAIHRFSLLDPRFSDRRRETEFDRDTDDWGKVQGLMTLTVE